METPYPLKQANRKLAPETMELVDRMLEHRASDRPGTAGELADAVEGAIDRLDARATFRPSRPGVRRPRAGRVRRRRRR